LKSFPAVILGGLDSVIGASLAGLIIAVIENLAQGYLGEGVREIAGFVVIIVVLMCGPTACSAAPTSSGSELMRTGNCKESVGQIWALSASKAGGAWTAALITALIVPPYLVGAYALT